MTEFGPPERHLMQVDPVLGVFVQQFGACDLQLQQYEGTLFSVLANAILGQQISTHAAAAIRRRFVEKFGEGGEFPTPDRVVTTSDEELRALGFSFRKATYIRGLADAVLRDLPTLADLAEMSDEAVITALLPLRGVGRWTVEMLLIFRLGRPDVFPADDLGVRNGMMRLYGLAAPPRPAEMRVIAASWAPYRSYGAWYMWRALTAESLTPPPTSSP